MIDRQEDGWRALCDAVRGSAARIVSETLRKQEREAAKEQAARKIGMAIIEILEEAAPFIAAAIDAPGREEKDD